MPAHPSNAAVTIPCSGAKAICCSGIMALDVPLTTFLYFDEFCEAWYYVPLRRRQLV
ncbi:hypothetical protein J2S71_000009 [Olsenella profusa DSM 13989]|uniref:hypothetical protein n=1 Tax=Olsenella profusa TaxID=138595 RepID=UPI00278700E7|nr:hypothetical protein [Olsenella profusa]MDP9858313.1 hypothetical protein [Olsenella profusa DSM 13989]